MKFLLQHCKPNPDILYADSIVVPEGTTEIVAQGGGSTIDVGKWLAHKYKIKLTAIPTTAGTGSEVTRYCVLTVDGKKTTFDLALPDSYILDPSLVTTLPELHTVSSGLDALSQCFEALWSNNNTIESITYSQVGINLITDNLYNCVRYPENKTFRMNMLIAANMSGRAIEITRTNVCHAISYPLTDWYGIPHGIACAITLPYFAKKFIGADLSIFMKLFNTTKVKIDRKKVAREVIKSPKLKDCPKPVTEKDIYLSMV